MLDTAGDRDVAKAREVLGVGDAERAAVVPERRAHRVDGDCLVHGTDLGGRRSSHCVRRVRTSAQSVVGLFWVGRLGPAAVAVVGASVLVFGVAAALWAVTISNVGAVRLAGYFYYSTSNRMLRQAAAEATGRS